MQNHLVFTILHSVTGSVMTHHLHLQERQRETRRVWEILQRVCVLFPCWEAGNLLVYGGLTCLQLLGHCYQLVNLEKSKIFSLDPSYL